MPLGIIVRQLGRKGGGVSQTTNQSNIKYLQLYCTPFTANSFYFIKVRSKIRLIEGREKPIDVLARIILLIESFNSKEKVIFTQVSLKFECH